MHRVRYLLALMFALVLAWTGCSNTTADEERVVASLTAELDFDSGDVQGTVMWNGEALAGSSAFLYVTGEGDAQSWFQYIDGQGQYLVQGVAPDDYAAKLYPAYCGDPVATANVTVAAQSTATANFDVSGTMGKVTGSITFNDVPAEALLTLDSCVQGFYTDSAGEFTRFLPVGTYTATVNSGTVLSSFTFTVLPGETTDIGIFNVQTGAVQGTVIWNGEALAGSSAFLYVTGEGDAQSWFQYIDGQGQYLVQGVAPDDYAAKLYPAYCGDPVATANVTVAAQSTATANFDVSGTMGKVTGSITFNDVPAEALLTLDSCVQGFYTDSAGEFTRFLPVGTYTATVNSGTVLSSFTFTVLPGETTDIGIFNVQTGAVQGTVIWNGEALAGSSAFLYVTGEGDAQSWFQYIDGQGQYLVQGVAPDDYAAKLYPAYCGDPVATANVTVAAQSTATANFDVSGTMGKVTGSITFNDVPAEALLTLDSCVQGFYTDSAGEFTRFLPVGTYTATVNAGTALGTFTFTVLAGQTTNVDLGTTPAGLNVMVDLSGGIGSVGGISLTFSEITQSGETTVVESGAGPPPPTGFRIVGISVPGQPGQPRYWDIDTTAIFTGPVTVCIHYDETEVQGQETNLTLRHDDESGNGFQNITTSLDTDANIICGVATSLSPFAVFEPLDADTDGDGVFDSADQCGATQAGMVVDATGCSIDDLVPCVRPGTPWRNHGAYVSAFTAVARSFLNQGLIGKSMRSELVARAAQSNCGKR